MTYSESVVEVLKQIAQDESVKQGIEFWNKNKSSAKYEDVENFSKKIGSATAKYLEPIAQNLDPQEIKQIYKHVSNIVIKYANDASEDITHSAGLRYVPSVEIDVKKDINDMLDNLVTRLADWDEWEDVKFLVQENAARSITRKASTSHLKYTSRKQQQAGMSVLISRDEGGGCCEWCASIAGTYTSYDDLPSDFWQVHRNCTCVFHYKVGKTQDRISFITDDKGNISKRTEEE